MKLTNALTQWLEEFGGEERPEVGEDGQHSRTEIYLRNHSQGDEFGLRCVFDCFEDEKDAWFQLYMYWFDSESEVSSDVVCPEERWDDAQTLAAYLNNFVSFGCWQFVLNRRALRFFASIPVGGAPFESTHINRLVGAGIHQTALALPKFKAVYFDGQTVEQVLSDSP